MFGCCPTSTYYWFVWLSVYFSIGHHHHHHTEAQTLFFIFPFIFFFLERGKSIYVGIYEYDNRLGGGIRHRWDTLVVMVNHVYYIVTSLYIVYIFIDTIY